MKEKRKSKAGRNPKLDPAVYRYTVRFNEEEHNRFLAMFGKSGVYARSVFLKAHFFGQPFKVLKVDKTLVDYYTKLSDFHAQFRAVGTNYNQVVIQNKLLINFVGIVAVGIIIIGYAFNAFSYLFI